MKEELTRHASNLGMKVVNPPELFVEAITHLVCPPNSRTLKVVAATVSGRWVLSTDWLVDSAKKGEILPEKDYGSRSDTILAGKKVFCTKKFTEKKGSIDRYQYLKQIVELGKGHLTSDQDEADIIVTEAKENVGETKAKILTWNDFVTHLTSLNSIPTTPVSTASSSVIPEIKPGKSDKPQTKDAKTLRTTSSEKSIKTKAEKVLKSTTSEKSLTTYAEKSSKSEKSKSVQDKNILLRKGSDSTDSSNHKVAKRHPPSNEKRKREEEESDSDKTKRKTKKTQKKKRSESDDDSKTRKKKQKKRESISSSSSEEAQKKKPTRRAHKK